MRRVHVFLAILAVAACTPAGGSTPTAPATIATPTPLAGGTDTAPPATPAPTPQLVGTVTIRADGCTLDGTGLPIHEGRVALLVVNVSGFQAGADLWNILAEAGGTYEALALDTEEKHEAALRGEMTGNHPPYLRGIITRRAVPDGQELLTSGYAKAGTAAIVCLRRFDETGSISPLDTVGPIEVGEAR